MSTEQFKRRTSALKLPKEIYDKIAPSRAKVSGIRSEVFGELTFIDHGEVSTNPQSKLQCLLYDGATSLTTAYVVQNRSDLVTISRLQEYFETHQLNPKNTLLLIKLLWAMKWKITIAGIAFDQSP